MNEKNERIVFDVAFQPQVRTDRDTRSLMLDVIIALLPVLVVGVWQFGTHPLLVVACSIAACVFFEWGYRKLLHKEQSIGDLSAVVTGLLLGLSMPSTTPAWVPVVGAFFAIVVVKQLYGGIGKNFLNPALAGRAFLLSSYSILMSTWAVPKSLQGTVDGVTMATPLSYLYGDAAMPKYFSFQSLFLGNTPGSVGEVSTLILIAACIYLIVRKVISWRIPVSFVGTVFVLTLLFGRNGDHFDFALYNVLSGALLLVAVFMATDYSTSPVTIGGQLLYGFGCGAITVLIRYFGGFPEGTTYAVLIMNLCTWAIDKGFHRRQFGVSKEDIAKEKAQKMAAKEAAK
ncbi:MAG: RnfABCDGE type electron transport complex subunit D [Oscillospiraceae bacterium]|nr:RnfABCDGE type electron transport complex subunit D [Oscillospiraceae bacterium]